MRPQWPEAQPFSPLRPREPFSLQCGNYATCPCYMGAMWTTILMACIGGQAEATPEPLAPDVPPSASELLAQIQALAPPFSPSHVEKLLGVALEPDAGTSPYRSHQADAAPPFKDIEVRVPADGTERHAMVYVEIAGDLCVTLVETKAALGDLSPMPLHPGRPINANNSYQARRDWGRIIVGFDPFTHCLAVASLQANGGN
jgi:hypothetical protein